MEVNNHISVILLAAGASMRMGTLKQMLPLDGEPMLTRAARMAIAVGGTNAVAVLGAQADELKKNLGNVSIQCVINPEWSQGMGSSIKAGMRWIIEYNPGTTGVLIVVCDQPAVSATHLHALVARHDGPATPVVASTYAGTTGVPALFDSTLFGELLSLPDAEGAKAIIMRYRDQVTEVSLPGGEVDLDTRGDYERYVGK